MPAANFDRALYLDSQLDALLAGIDPEKGQSHDDVAPTLHHLQRLFVRPLPDPTFVDRLDRDLMNTVASDPPTFVLKNERSRSRSEDLARHLANYTGEEHAAVVIPGSLALHSNSAAPQITDITLQPEPHSRRRQWDVAAALLVIAVLGGYLSLANPDHAFPTPWHLGGLSAQSEAVIPDPAECQVEPTTVAQLDAIAARMRSKPRQRPVSTPLAALTGEPADTATKDAVMRVERELVACLNARDALRTYALYTDDGLERLFDYAYDPTTPLDLTMTWNPDFSDLRVPATPLPEAQRLALLSVEDIRILQDGRVVATVTTSPTTGRLGFFGTLIGTPVVHILEPGTRYLIDEFIVPSLGTPAP